MSSAPSATRPLRVLDVHHDERGTHVSLRATIDNSPRDLAAVEAGPTGSATMLLDAELPMPDSERLGRLLGGPCHVWHAGLRLGQGGRPTTWEACHSRAMFSRDADDSIESTSWRMSSRAVLIRNEVLARFGGFDATFDTASGAALDAGADLRRAHPARP